jgi:DNA polymerase-3 subunit beta
MHLVIHKEDLTRVLGAVSKVIEARNTIPILSCFMLTAAATGDAGGLSVMGTDLDILATAGAPATVTTGGSICVEAKLLTDIARKATGDVTMTLDDGKLVVKSGRSRFSLQTLSAEDFPDLGKHNYDAEFETDLAALFAPVSFAISSEEVRFYLNGIYFRGGSQSVAVATDGHRLAKHEGPELPAFEGVIVPRKLVGLVPKGLVKVSVSQQKIRLETDALTLTSKLIDGTFPDYERVIPKQNDKFVVVDRDAIMKAADRVATVSSERGRAVKFSIAPGSISLLVSNPDSGSANDEVEAEYSGEPLDIGFNAQYVKDVFGVLPAGAIRLALADSGSPAVVTGGLDGWTGVIMPMRV